MKPRIRFDWRTGRWSRISIARTLLDLAIDFELKGYTQEML